VASGKIIGTTTGTSASKYSFWVEWSSKAYPSGNYSLVTATAYLQRNDGYAESAYNLNVAASGKYVIVNGNKTISTKKGIDTRNSAKVVIASAKNIKVMHESNGEKTITISAAFPYLISNLSGGSLSKKVALDKIDVAKPVISVSTLNISQNEITFELSANSTINLWQYSIDDGNIWIELSSAEGTSLTETISGLSPNTKYSFLFKGKKSSNDLEGITDFAVQTLPIYATDIIFDDSISLDVGSTNQLDYTILPENASIKELEIISENPNIISVVGNEVIVLQKGTANLILKTKDGSNISKSVLVNAVQRVKGITANQTELTIPKAQEVQLQYTVLPSDANDKSVIVTTSDENVVSVNGSSILGVDNGSATVTITTNDGAFSVDIYVSVFGDYVWYEYSQPIEILNALDLDHIASNIRTVHTMMIEKGFYPRTLEGNINPNTDTELTEIFDLFSKIKYNINAVGTGELPSIYSNYLSQNMGEYAPDKDEIWNWLQILNDLYDMLNGAFGMWQTVLTTNGYPTIDGKRLITRGDFIG
jgi:uncharacterized protein YjdB